MSTADLPRKRVGAGVLFFDAEGRVLLVEPTHKDDWEIPGGWVEADESPYESAIRERPWSWLWLHDRWKHPRQ